jgi:hypothetical protein
VCNFRTLQMSMRHPSVASLGCRHIVSVIVRWCTIAVLLSTTFSAIPSLSYHITILHTITLHTGLAVITGVRTNLLLQTEYRISSDVSLDCWVRLKRQKGTGGTEFQPLRKVLTTKQCSTKMRVMQYKKTM